ncbi:MAG: hypothetical protein K2X47_05005 [Bdellovibrionales bacterium]|nr:hypothetical protein [Bdellovibrionales bacterium]
MLESDSNQWMTVFGLLIDHRMFLFLRQSHLWANLSYRPRLRLMFLALGFLIPILNFESVIVGYLLQLIMIVGMIGSRFHFIKRQEDRLRQSFHGWLENILLRMKMGSSFRSAYTTCLGKCKDAELRALLARQEIGLQMNQKIQNFDPLSSCSPPFFREVFQRMGEIDTVPHRAQARVESLIVTWRQELWFRRRSRQVRRQSQVQLSFLGLMYLILMLWSAHRYPVARFWPAMKVSLLLILGGLAVVLFLHRSRQWKI